MSSVNEIRFAVEQAVLDIGVKIVFPVIEGIDNTLTSPEWMESDTRKRGQESAQGVTQESAQQEGNDMIFTVEETTLIGAFDPSSRNAAMLKMAAHLKLIEVYEDPRS